MPISPKYRPFRRNIAPFAPFRAKIAHFAETLPLSPHFAQKLPISYYSSTLIFGEKEKERYNEETRCWICKGEFDDEDKNKEKVKDHCHYTGRYRGAAHNECNLNYRKPNFTPVVFHNLSGYDSHLFIKNLGFSEGNIDCIPNNEEKYISFSKKIEVKSYTKEEKEIKVYHTIRFIDSFKFMATSLEKLVNNLPKDDCINLGLYYSGDKFNLLARKGVYPYEYMDSLEKLKETALPPKEAFYSRLNDGGISDEDYAHAQNVWKTFKMKYFKDYHELYNKVDVLLLADVFEHFRNICLENYELDPAHYYTAPGLAGFSLGRGIKSYRRKFRTFIGYGYVINGRRRY